MRQPAHRIVTLLGVLLALAGLALQTYFEHGYDTWVWADVSAPPGFEVPGDPREAALHPSAERQAHARAGARLGLGAAAAGALLVVAGLAAARRRRGQGER